MAQDREKTCEFYTYAGGPCDKRGISVHFKDECQTCKYYSPLKNAKPARVNNKRKKIEDAKKKDNWE